jgi:hypothetical protein
VILHLNIIYVVDKKGKDVMFSFCTRFIALARITSFKLRIKVAKQSRAWDSCDSEAGDSARDNAARPHRRAEHTD